MKKGEKVLWDWRNWDVPSFCDAYITLVDIITIS